MGQLVNWSIGQLVNWLTGQLVKWSDAQLLTCSTALLQLPNLQLAIGNCQVVPRRSGIWLHLTIWLHRIW